MITIHANRYITLTVLRKLLTEDHAATNFNVNKQHHIYSHTKIILRRGSAVFALYLKKYAFAQKVLLL